METIDLKKATREPIQGHTSKGDQPKWQFGGNWYKADHMGYEALAEVVIARLLRKSNLQDFVLYEPVIILGEGKQITGCKSRNFREKNEMLIPFERLHRAYKGIGLAQAIANMDSSEEQITYTVDFIESVTHLTNVGQYLTCLMELDALFLNEDRHTNNLAVIRKDSTKEFRFCPIFDNGLSLLSDLNDYPIDADIYDCISRVKAKPFDRNYNIQVSTAEKLYGQQIHLGFTRRDVSEALNELSGMYSDSILLRVESVIFEQMRKYPIYF